MVVNPSSGAQPQIMDPVRQLRTALPEAEGVLYEQGAGPLPQVLVDAAGEAAARGGVQGVCGGDGTINTAVGPALKFGVPLMVLPGGTFNHFAADLGVETVADACAALAVRTAVRADVGRVKTLRPREGSPASGAEPAYFLNTFSLGVYPELVRLRERWSPRIGGPPATLLGVVHILRTARPLRAAVNGRRHSMWLLFAGNSAYRSMGVAPVRRHDLADGLLDVRIAHGGPFARTRLLATALAGVFAKTRLYAAARPTRLLISDLPLDAHLAFDGEVVPAPSALLPLRPSARHGDEGCCDVPRR
ncbi:diacylglycerol kinase family protein [Streptomyces sp. NBC_01255]|nr:diacylglycerol kinase family protein [Streptomyces sp. NBC_01255]